MKKINVFIPQSIPVVIWNILMFSVLLSQLFVIPLKISYELTYDDNMLLYLVFIFVPTVICVADILIKFNTAFYDRGQIVTDRYMIIVQYVKGNFFIDIITCFTLLLNQIFVYQWFQVIFLIKIYQMGRITDDIDERFQLQQRFPTFRILIKMFIQILLIAHISSCVFHFIAWNDIKNYHVSDKTWIHAQKLQDSPWGDRYMSSLYFTVINMSTVGFGDITPISIKERIWIIFMTLLSCGQFGYVVNTIGQIFLEMAEKEALYKSKKYEITKYMRNRGVDSLLQIQVLKYIDYIQFMKDEDPEKGHSILNEVSNKLRKEVYTDFFGKILKKEKFFKQNFSNEFLNELTTQMKEVIYGPGEVIYNQGEQEDRIFFVVQGQIELIFKANSRDYQFDIIQKDQCIGLENLIEIKSTTTSSRSINLSHIVYFKYESFIEVIKNYSLDYVFQQQIQNKEKFCMIKDQQQTLTSYCQVKCNACNTNKHHNDHSILQCSMMHFIKHKPIILTKHLYNLDQKRKKKQNKQNKRFNTLLQNQQIKKKMKKLRIKSIQKALDYKIMKEYKNENVFNQTSIQNNELTFNQQDRSSISEISMDNSSEISSVPDSDREFYEQCEIIKYVSHHWDIEEIEQENVSDTQSDNSKDNSKISQTDHIQINDEFKKHQLQNSDLSDDESLSKRRDSSGNGVQQSMKSKLLQRKSMLITNTMQRKSSKRFSILSPITKLIEKKYNDQSSPKEVNKDIENFQPKINFSLALNRKKSMHPSKQLQQIDEKDAMEMSFSVDSFDPINQKIAQPPSSKLIQTMIPLQYGTNNLKYIQAFVEQNQQDVLNNYFQTNESNKQLNQTEVQPLNKEEHKEYFQIDNQIDQSNFFICPMLDIAKEYKYYFPLFNVSYILHCFEKNDKKQRNYNFGKRKQHVQGQNRGSFGQQGRKSKHI